MNHRPADREGLGLGRVWRVNLVVALPFLVLVLRLFTLQVLGSERYYNLSEDNRLHNVRIVAPRGFILDRRGRVLAENVTACELSLPTRNIETDPGMIGELARILGRPETQIREPFLQALADGKTRVVLDHDLKKPQILMLEERASDFPGIQLTDWARRSYPHGMMAGHVLGYVGEVNEGEVELNSPDPRAYRLGDLIGRAGVEETYEDILRGADGKELVIVNARGDRLESWWRGDPEPGYSLVLTLDLDLCAQLDSALAQWGSGAGVVIDVHTGEVLAAASRPVYDPNLLVGGIPAELWQQFTQDPLKPLFNRLTQATYAPGSAFKPFLLLQGLSTGAITESSHFRSCGGGLRAGNRYFHCWRPGGHGSLAAVNALEQSCDVYFYQLGELLGLDQIAEGARRFGLGSPSGIEISGEAKGNIPDEQWFDKRYGERGWATGSVWNVAIGQGEVLVNCLQMARAYAGLATGGFLPVLRLRHHVENASGLVIMPFSPPRGERINVDRLALQIVHDGLELVLQGAGGTARGSRLAGLRTAGKTGTVQNPHGRPHGWFCGYAPAENPEIAVAIIVEHAEHGSAVAPIFRRLVATHFGLDLEGKPAPAPEAREGD